MLKADVLSGRWPEVRGEFSQVFRASLPGRGAPLWSVWWFAFLFWLADCGFSLYTGGLRHASREAHPPDGFFQTLIINTPVIAKLLTLVLMYLLVAGLHRRPFLRTLHWGFAPPASPDHAGSRPRPFGPAAVGIAAALVVVATRALLLIPGPKTQADELLRSSPMSLYVNSLTAVVVAPFVEELLYRGLLFRAFERALDTGCAVIFSVVLFTVVHFGQFTGGQGEPNWGQILSVVVLGGTCAGLRAYTGRIAPAYFVHLGMNFYVALTLLFNYDPVWLLMKKLIG